MATSVSQAILSDIRMKVVQITTDNREHHREYDLPEPYFGAAPEALLQGLATLTTLELHVISCTQRPMQSPTKLAENIWFHSLHVPKIGWLRTGYQGCIRAIRRKVDEIQPDIVHGQGTERECALGAVFSGFPNVVTIHGNMNAIAKATKARIASYWWWMAILERFTLPRTFGVFCNSPYTEAMVKPRARKTWLVPNAVRREFFDAPLPASKAHLKPILVNVGVISPRKRQLELLSLAEELHGEGHRFEIQFIGVADQRDKYAAAFLQKVQTAEGQGFARYLGTKSLQELIATLDAAAALVHVPFEEAFGLVAAEALARNLKFFGTKLGGLVDIAGGVESAELFQLGDSASVKAAIKQWLRASCPHPTSAASEMRRRYHPGEIAARHVKIYREMARRVHS